MGKIVRLKASDGFEFDAYRAEPEGSPRGAVVVIQEIFGINHHIRSVCDRLAAVGYVAIAPALFDRLQPGYERGYSSEEVEESRGLMQSADRDAMMRDTEAAIDAVRDVGPVAIVGFCLGGSLAYFAATRIDGLSAAVCFYGGLIAKASDEVPKCATQMHFGGQDHGIPVADVETIRARRPDCEVWLYAEAGHGFNCDERASFHPESAAIAWMRTGEWLARHMK